MYFVLYFTSPSENNLLSQKATITIDVIESNAHVLLKTTFDSKLFNLQLLSSSARDPFFNKGKTREFRELLIFTCRKCGFGRRYELLLTFLLLFRFH